MPNGIYCRNRYYKISYIKFLLSFYADSNKLALIYLLIKAS